MKGRSRNILILLIALVIVAAVFSSFGLPFFAGPTPTITLPTAPVSAAPTPEGGPTGGGERVEVTPATVRSVIAVMDRLDSYSRSVTTTMAGTAATARVWVDGGWTRSDLDLPSGITVHTIVGDGTVWRWYGPGGRVVSWPGDAASMDVEGQRIPTYEDVLALDGSDITAAGYEEKNGEACVYVETAVPELDQRERYWVSAGTGLLVAAENETGGEVVWSMTAAAPEVPIPAADVFTLPDGRVLHTAAQG